MGISVLRAFPSTHVSLWRGPAARISASSDDVGWPWRPAARGGRSLRLVSPSGEGLRQESPQAPTMWAGPGASWRQDGRCRLDVGSPKSRPAAMDALEKQRGTILGSRNETCPDTIMGGSRISSGSILLIGNLRVTVDSGVQLVGQQVHNGGSHEARVRTPRQTFVSAKRRGTNGAVVLLHPTGTAIAFFAYNPCFRAFLFPFGALAIPPL